MLGGHEEIGYYKHCQWILAGGHLTMKIYPAYPGQPLVSSQLFAAPLTQLSLAPHQALWLRVQLRTTLSVFTWCQQKLMSQINMENDWSHRRIYQEKFKVAYECRRPSQVRQTQKVIFQSRVSMKYATVVAPWLVFETPSGQWWSAYQLPTMVDGEQRPCACDLIKILNHCKYEAWREALCLRVSVEG